jgi:pyruvate,water dikinase
MSVRGGIGPKAESLRRLSGAGLPVPDAQFLGADAYREHAKRAGVDALLLSEGAETLDAAAVRAALESTPVAESVVAELAAMHRALGGGPVAVRSSGSAEDMPEASFAGQHGTYFVPDGERLADAVRECWASLYSDRAARYREHAGIVHDGVAMAVIIQRLVPAASAGVAFTVDPIDGSDRVLVESCFGIGEALVSGKVSPDAFTFEREGLVLTRSSNGTKPLRIVAGDDGRVTEERVDAVTAAKPSATEATAREVAALALEAERVFGAPVDVEWAFDGETVWLLQARPVTTLGGVRAAAESPVLKVAGRFTETAPGVEPVVWSNVNTGEILPDVASPMTWTIIHGHAQHVFGGLFDALGVHMDAQQSIGLVGGRIYFNLSLLRESIAHLPFIDTDLTLGGMQEYVELPVAAKGGKPRLLAVLRAGVAMPGYFGRHTARKARRFIASVRAENASTEAALAAGLDETEALALFQRLMGKFDSFNDALAFMMVGMGGFGVLAGLTKRWLGDETGAVSNRLVSGRGGVASAEAGHAMWALGTLAGARTGVRECVEAGGGWREVRARLERTDGADAQAAAGFLAAWDEFMSVHGHHRRGELEFANPTWSETPDYVLGIVRGYLARGEGADPIANYDARAAEADVVASECRAALRDPVRRAVFDRVLQWGRNGAVIRENVKSEIIRWLVSVRYTLLALADNLVEDGVLSDREDVFYLRWEEVAPIVAGPQSQDWRSIVAARRAEHDRLAALTPPPVVIGEWDEDEASWVVRSDSRMLRGMSVSAGVARGPARVFLSADTDETVLPGEILVAPFTDPGWTPYFVPAAGIVMDMGGLLSHGSIIAREYGIPAVVNVGPATRLITTGQIIEVDGDAGVVRIIG